MTKSKRVATKKRAKKSAVARPRATFGADAKIKLLAETNPKRPGSAAAKRFGKYKSGMTVAEALAAGLRRVDLLWDTRHGFIKIA